MFSNISIILLCGLLLIAIGYFKYPNRFTNNKHVINISVIFLISIIIYEITCRQNQVLGIEMFDVDDNLKLSNHKDTQENITNNGIGATSEHLELAYKLCQNNPDRYCQKYIHHYDSLRKSFHKLKDDYCKKYPSRCMELGL